MGISENLDKTHLAAVICVSVWKKIQGFYVFFFVNIKESFGRLKTNGAPDLKIRFKNFLLCTKGNDDKGFAQRWLFFV